jgi:hypothetical protein
VALFKPAAPVPWAALASGKPPTPKGDTPDGERELATLTRRRTVAASRLQAAADVLNVALPEADGDCAHFILTGFFDPCDLLLATIDKIGVVCNHLRIATLSLSPVRNLPALVELLDLKHCHTLTLLLSRFSADMDPQIITECKAALEERGQTVVATSSHCKFALLHLADGSKWVMAGSANLRSSRNFEQVTLSRDAAAHDFYAAWFDGEVGKNAAPE